MSTPPPPPAWVLETADAGPTIEVCNVIPAWSPDAGLEVQIVQREVRTETSGQLVEFAVQIEAREVGGTDWSLVVRVDTAHEHVHCDRGVRGTKAEEKDEETVPLECRESLDTALSWALDYVWNVQLRIEEW